MRTHFRVMSNFQTLGDVPGAGRLDCRPLPYPCDSLRNCLRNVLAAWRADALVLNQADRQLYLACLVKLLLPFLGPRLVSVDLILTKPGDGLLGRLRGWFKGLLLRRIDRVIQYQKDCTGYQRHYGLRAERLCYVPFKVNGQDRLSAFPPRDEGYVFSGGRSRRDYATLLRAAAELPYPVVLLTPASGLEIHGTRVLEGDLPPNVRLVHDDGSADSWIRHMAAARVVALPITADSISPSGIGTYLLAMALGKCVVITDSSATRGLLTDRHDALLVPVTDAAALRDAIRTAWEDDALRARLGAAARQYALSLGGEERLVSDIARETTALLDAVHGPQQSARPARAAA